MKAFFFLALFLTGQLFAAGPVPTFTPFTQQWVAQSTNAAKGRQLLGVTAAIGGSTSNQTVSAEIVTDSGALNLISSSATKTATNGAIATAEALTTVLAARPPQVENTLGARLNRITPTDAINQYLWVVRTGTNAFDASVYVPANTNASVWSKWAWTTQGNPATSGPTRPIRITLSELYTPTNQGPANTGVSEDANLTSGTQAYAATTTISYLDGGRVETSGVWVSGGATTPTGRYTLTANAILTYTITDASRLVWKTYNNNSNGGVVTYAITQAGTPISDSQYVWPTGTKKINQRRFNSSATDKFGYVELAQNLDSSLTYVVTFTRAAADNTGTWRMYDIQLLGYADAADKLGVKYTALGYGGTFDLYPSFTNVAGSEWVGAWRSYAVTNATRIAWRHATRQNGGWVAAIIYDSGGTEITGYSTNLTVTGSLHYLDTYTAAGAIATTTIADGLTKGTYYVRLQSMPFKNAANVTVQTDGGTYTANPYCLFDGGVVSCDTGVPGVLGTDPFIDYTYQFFGGGSDPADDGGNILWAGQVRLSTDGNFASDPSANAGYVSGIHGAESALSNLTVLIDGKSNSWSGITLNTGFAARTIQLDFDTTLRRQFNTNQIWASAHYRYFTDKSGLDQRLDFTTISNIYAGYWYGTIAEAPNDNLTGANATGVGGGFVTWAVDGDALYSWPYTTTYSEILPNFSRGAAAYNTNYVIWYDSINPRLNAENYTYPSYSRNVHVEYTRRNKWYLADKVPTDTALGDFLLAGYHFQGGSKVRVAYSASNIIPTMQGTEAIPSASWANSKVIVSDTNGLLTNSVTTATEVGYLSGVTTPTGAGALVLATSPTIVTPTIASFVNANHAHQTAAGGGTLDAAAIAAGTVATARLGSGSASSANFLRGDQTWAIVPGASAFVITADGTVANTTVETTLLGTVTGSKTLTAGFFTAGKASHGVFRGRYGTKVTPGTLTINVKLGATTILTTGAQTMPSLSTTKIFDIDLDINCRTAGAGGTVFAQGKVLIGDASGLIPQVLPMVNTTTSTVDTTGTLVFDVTATWQNADASNTATISVGDFE